MLSYLSGKLVRKDMLSGALDRVVLDVAGIGLEIIVSRKTMIGLGEIGDTIQIASALVIRETEWTVYGFGCQDERSMFELLQTASGVGPKLAVGMLSALSPDEIAEAILVDNHKFLSQAPGVGQKLAQRMIIELKGKMDSWQEQRGIKVSLDKAPSSQPVYVEAGSILEGLGYTLSEIDLALKSVSKETTDLDIESLVRHSLKFLSAR
jgi:Holliday junction DNA helicase RuvA